MAELLVKLQTAPVSGRLRADIVADGHGSAVACESGFEGVIGGRQAGKRKPANQAVCPIRRKAARIVAIRADVREANPTRQSPDRRFDLPWS